MTTSPESTQDAWRVLQLGGGSTEFSIATVRLALDVGYGPVRLGMGADREPRLLIPTESGQRVPEGLSGPGVTVRMVHYVVADRSCPFIEVTCFPGLDDVFQSLADDILRRLKAGTGPELAVGQAITDFRELLARARPQSLEMLIGLFGELHFLDELLRAHPAAASTWTGPLGQRFDFSGARCCAEIKSTLQRSGMLIRVSSIDQLEPPEDGRSLVLVHIVLERPGTGGQSVRELIEQTREHCSTPDVIDRSLAALGIGDWRTRHVLGDERFRVLRKQFYEIIAGFPKLGRDSFRAGQPPPGITEITYALDLAHAAGFQLEAARSAAVLGEIVSEQ
jgi:hypothetical protein